MRDLLRQVLTASSYNLVYYRQPNGFLYCSGTSLAQTWLKAFHAEVESMMLTFSHRALLREDVENKHDACPMRASNL